jgi:hypothetical protein
MEFDPMRQLAKVNKRALGGLALLMAGCAGTPTAVAPRFNGVWVTTSGTTSWMEVQAHSIVSFAVTLSNGRCAATQIEIVAKDRVNAPVSAIGSGLMSLKMQGGALVISGKLSSTRLVPGARESICLGRGGVYAPGAPYPKTR